jgi:hypothetical protein
VGHRPSAVEGLEVNPSFWRGKRVLLAVHTGFKGSWLAIWLKALVARGLDMQAVTHEQIARYVQLEAA